MMAGSLEDLRILQMSEALADDLWQTTARWDSYTKNVMGQQLCRAVDSIGANIAESFGRYHYGEKIRFLYYARGSLFETKYWLNRAHSRQLITTESNRDYANRLNALGRQLNQFVNQLKAQKRKASAESDLREPAAQYFTAQNQEHEFLFQEELDWLSQQDPAIHNRQSPISNP